MAAADAVVERYSHQTRGIKRSAAALRENRPTGRPPQALSREGSSDFESASTASPPTKLQRKATFRPSASLVLIGVRGVGASTLGVLAATAYDRRLVDSERAFHEATGSTKAAYRLAHGVQAYQVRHHQVLRATLETHSEAAVIVCTFSDLEKQGASLIREYAQSHPVIHVLRDAAGIQSCLNAWTLKRIKQLLSASRPLLRSCTNYDFYNLSEPAKQNLPSNANPLTLKRVERDFLRMLRNIIGDEDRGPSHQSAYPLSQLNLRDRLHTFAATINVTHVTSGQVDQDKVQTGADCIELVHEIDVNDLNKSTELIDSAFSIVRRASIVPILVSIRKKPNSGSIPQSLLCEFTEYCLRLAPELCTVDMALEDSQITEFIRNKGKSMVIGVQEFENRPAKGWDDSKCAKLCERATGLGCDLVKITMPADDEDDAFAIHAFRKTMKQRIPSCPGLIAYTTGPRGRMSKCFNQILTPVTAREPTTTEACSDDDVTAKELTQALYATFRLPPLQFWIYGANVAQSLSPAMHNTAYEACGMRYSCQAYSHSTLDDFIKMANSPSFGGAAMAQPFKTAVLPLLDGLSVHAKTIAAVNTVVPIRARLANGSVPDEWTIIAQRSHQGSTTGLFGYNSDWIGIRACIRRGLSPANTVRPESCGLVCGAGGMARAAIYSMLSLGVRNVFICNRTRERATALAEHYNRLIETGQMTALNLSSAAEARIHVIDSFDSNWPAKFRPPTIIVCCIPREAGDGSPINLSLSEDWLTSSTGGVVMELSYSQPVPPLVQQIQRRARGGWVLMDGFDMIPEQAFTQFELFTGRRAPRKLMRDEMMKFHPSAS